MVKSIVLNDVSVVPLHCRHVGAIDNKKWNSVGGIAVGMMFMPGFMKIRLLVLT
jgi:hypothetical protein